MSFYIVTYYLPSGLFVVVSWISFLVNPEVIVLRKWINHLSPFLLRNSPLSQVIPGRMTLLITIFLVLINIFNTIQTNSPQVPLSHNFHQQKLETERWRKCMRQFPINVLDKTTL